MDASLLDFWQTGCGYRLPVSLVFFVRNMKNDPAGEVAELGCQYMFCAVDNEIAAFARRNPAKNQHALKIVEIPIMGERIAEIRTDGLIDLRGSLVALSH